MLSGSGEDKKFCEVMRMKTTLLIFAILSYAFTFVIVLEERHGSKTWEEVEDAARMIAAPTYLLVMLLTIAICRGIEIITGKDLGI